MPRLAETKKHSLVRGAACRGCHATPRLASASSVFPALGQVCMVKESNSNIFSIVSPIVLEIQPEKVSVFLILRGCYLETSEPTIKNKVPLDSSHLVDY